MARPTDQAEKVDQIIKVRAIEDDERSGRFKTGDVFELPFAKALDQMAKGTVEPIIKIKDRRTTIPEEGLSFYDAYRAHMRSYPEIAQAVDNSDRTIGGLNFAVKFCRQPAKWPRIKPLAPQKPTEHDWHRAAREGRDYPRIKRIPGRSHTPLDEQYEEGVHEFRLQHARFRFFELLCGGHLKASGIPEDRRYEATTMAIPAYWWSEDIFLDIKKSEIYDVVNRKNIGPRTWLKVQVHSPLKITPTGRKRVGRPSAKPLFVAEFERRKLRSAVRSALSEEARELEIWRANHHPDGPPAKAETIQGYIRDHFNAYWETRSAP